jgi:hypothetical protein
MKLGVCCVLVWLSVELICALKGLVTKEAVFIQDDKQLKYTI